MGICLSSCGAITVGFFMPTGRHARSATRVEGHLSFRRVCYFLVPPVTFQYWILHSEGLLYFWCHQLHLSTRSFHHEGMLSPHYSNKHSIYVTIIYSLKWKMIHFYFTHALTSDGQSHFSLN